MPAKAQSEDLRNILSIGRDVSIRGKGISLRKAIDQTHYKSLREMVVPEDLVKEIRKESRYVDDWIQFCEDKRTSSGWVLVPESNEIWLFENPEKRIEFNSIEEAVANYIIAELDYWSQSART